MRRRRRALEFWIGLILGATSATLGWAAWYWWPELNPLIEQETQEEESPFLIRSRQAGV